MAYSSGSSRTPTKRSSELAGFVHNVSPLKISKTNHKYFHAELQESSSEYKRLVCFDPRKHDTLLEAQKAKRPLVFDNIKLGMNLQDSTKTDVIVNDRSTVQVKAKIGFEFHNKTEPSTESPIKLKDMDTIPNFNKVTVLATVMEEGDGQVQEVRGELISKKTTSISDETGSICLTVWGDASVEKDKSYRFKNLSVRTIDGSKVVTTTPTTEITEIPNMSKDHLCPPVALVTQQITTESIVSVLIKQSANCTSCNRSMNIENKSDKFVRCNNCSMKMKTSSVTNTLTATFVVKADKDNVKLTAFSSTIATYLLVEGQSALMKDKDLVEDYFLSIDTDMNFSYGLDKIVTKISKSTL